MNRVNKILSIAFAALMLFLNIGLAVGLGGKLHAHFAGNGILIHFHSMGTNGEHAQGHSPDMSMCGFEFTSTLTFLDSAQSIKLSEASFKFLSSLKKYINEIPSLNIFLTSPLRAPPLG